MKIATIFSTLLLASAAIGQQETETLPSFYDQSEGNKVISVDMESNGIEPVVVYTTFNHNDVKCKLWDGQEWVTHGTFPAVKNRGTVNLEFYNKKAYALVQGGNGWSLFLKDNDDWKIMGNANFAGTKVFSEPTLTFIDGNPLIYEQEMRSRKISVYTYQNGEFLSVDAISKLTDVGDDFQMVSNKENQMIVAWTGSEKKSLQLFELNRKSTETSVKTITKGLKTKEIKEIRSLFYHKGKLILFYLDHDWDFHAVRFCDNSSKWENIELKGTIGELGFYRANDASFVSKSRENDLPVFYKYNGTNWELGEEVGSIKILHGKTVKLNEGLGSYYLLNFNSKGETVVQSFEVK